MIKTSKTKKVKDVENFKNDQDVENFKNNQDVENLKNEKNTYIDRETKKSQKMIHFF